MAQFFDFNLIRRVKKDFLSDQCKEIEENNRMRKTRDLFKKIRHTKGIFHAKMGTIKDRNSMDLTEAEDMKKRWQEYTEELNKRDLCDPINTPGLPVYHQLQEFMQTRVHRVGNAISPSHPLSSPPSPAPNPSQHQGLFLIELFFVQFLYILATSS